MNSFHHHHHHHGSPPASPSSFNQQQHHHQQQQQQQPCTPEKITIDSFDSFSSHTPLHGCSRGDNNSSALLLSPLPRPDWTAFEDLGVFSAKSSAKKKKSTRHDPPLAPFKSPSVSRMGLNNSRRDLFTPHAKVIQTSESLFLHTPEQNLFSTPSAVAEKRKSLFDELFINLGLLGVGSFAEVFKVQSREDPTQFYAVKKLMRPFRGTGDRDRALREVESCSKIMDHPHCVHLLQAWEEKGFLFIQMELCDRGSLEDYLRTLGDVELAEDHIWSFLIDIAEGLQHMHHNELVHLDIKPANLFLTATGDLKIGDFGLCQRMDSSFVDSVEGDSSYMAPELLQGQFSLAADVFSLGATVFEMAAHVDMPRSGQLWQRLRQGNFNLPCNRSWQLKQLVAWMMAPDPAARPSIDQVLQVTVQQCLMFRDQIKLATLRKVQALAPTIATRSPLLQGFGSPDSFGLPAPPTDTFSSPPQDTAAHPSPVSYRRELAVKLSFTPIDPLFSRQLF